MSIDAELSPSLFWDPGLPIVSHVDEILALLACHQVIVVAGDTGSGKSTQLPKICLAAGLADKGLIGHTQPRRIAARAVAERVASELKVPLGTLVGYQVRFHDQYSDQTRIKLMTDGVLLAEIQRDPLLKKYSVIIVDEAHERSLNIDFLLGYLKTLMVKRRDLKIILTSATIDHLRFSEHFNHASLVKVEGRTFPVDIVYQPLLPAFSGAREVESQDQAIARALTYLFKTYGPGDVLVFLSTEREIHEVAQDLKEFDARVEICKLFARLSFVAQQKIFHPKGGSIRVILSTNVAETSVTVPRIRYVIDAGTARVSRYRPGTKVQSLPIEKISQASANQRAGRCGRLSHGVCVRLYAQEDFELRPAFTDPEILRTHLSGIILQMKASRLGDIETFPFLDPPERQAIVDGYALLRALNALDLSGMLTPIGRTLARLPIDPRLGRMIVMGHQQGCLYDILVIVAQLSLQDPRERPVDKAAQADQVHAQFRHPCSDFLSDLALWEKLCEAHQSLSHRKFRSFCESHYLSIPRVMEWFDLFTDLKQRCIELGFPVSRQERFVLDSQNPKIDFLKDPHYIKLHRSILSGILGHIGQWNPEKKLYVGARQVNLQIFPGSTLKKKTPAWVMSFAWVETDERFMRQNAQIDVTWIEPLAQHLIQKTYRHPHFVLMRGIVCAFEQVSLYGLILVQKRLVPYGQIDPAEARSIFIKEGLIDSELPDKFLFWHHNQKLFEKLKDEGAKLRRDDVALDDEQLFNFYHTHLPLRICSLKQLSQLSLEALQKLYLTEERARRTWVDQAKLLRDFPDFYEISHQKLPLSYRFMPGEPDDGASLTIGLSHLLALNPAQLDYVVPGFLPAKAELLIRALPKSLRRQCLPVSDVIADVMADLTADLSEGFGLKTEIRFERYLREKLSRRLNLAIDADVWADVVMPPELTLHLVLISSKGEILAHSDDLKALQEIWALDAKKAWEEQMFAFSSELAHQIPNQILRHFPEHPLPISDRQGSGYWALEPVLQSGVKCVLQPSIDSAKSVHHAGVRVLLALHCQPLLKNMKTSPDFQTGSVLYSPFGSVTQWKEGLIACAIQMTFDTQEGYWSIRSQEAFERLLAQKDHLWGNWVDFTKQMKKILMQLQSVQKRLLGLKTQPKYREAWLDISAQLSGLFFHDFLLKIPVMRFARYEVYLSGIDIRCDRLLQDVSKDQVSMKTLQPFLTVNRERFSQEVQREYPLWLEELRISLFAQPLKTQMPISPVRMKTWCGVSF